MKEASIRSPGSVSFDLARFERHTQLGDASALPALRQVLDLFELGADLVASESRDPESPQAIAQYKRLASAIAALLANSELVLSLEDCDWLAYHNRHLAAVFRMAWSDGPDRVFRQVREAQSNAGNRTKFRNVLAAYSIAVSEEFDWQTAIEREPEATPAFFLASFTHRALLDVDASQRRDRLFEFAPQIARGELREDTLPVLTAAWMLCSYASAPDRHTLKPVLNGLIRNLFAQNAIHSTVFAAQREQDVRPTLVVVAEVLLGGHVMYKTYAHFLRQLRTRFRLVLVTRVTRVDETARALFDETIVLDTKAGAVAAIIKINSISPALIYYPSIGMSELTVLLCNLRLAPIQIASVGHPATTHSRSIDYMVMGHEYFGGAEHYSEQVLLLKSSGALFDPGSSAQPVTPKVRDDPDILRVAVPSSPMKLSGSFLELCRRVARSSGRAVEFRFFPNVTGLRYRDCRRQIEQHLPGAIVYPTLNFDTYRVQIGECDIYFGTYPFGGANIGVDAMLQGLAPIVFEGPEPHSRTDKRFIHLFGLPEWLISHDEEQYEKSALRLIQNDKERCAISRQILDAKPEEVLFSKEQSTYPTDFVDTVWWLYENHEHVKASDRRVWTWEDRQAVILGL